MKVLISDDMEGVRGVTSWVQVMPPAYESGPRSTVESERFSPGAGVVPVPFLRSEVAR